jgi:hypothetical protein
MSKQDAQNEAVNRALTELASVDLAARLPRLGLPAPANQTVALRMFGLDMRFHLEDKGLIIADTGQPAKPADYILLLHYLLCDLPVSATGELISFRDFTGGQFYYQPFQSRTTAPLIKRFGNNLEQLRRNFSRFDHELLPGADLTARIQAFGPLSITLIYRQGDDEFPASGDVLFDAAVKRALCAEDAAVLASRICIGLL